MVGNQGDTIFLGQTTAFSGHAISNTLTSVPKEKLDGRQLMLVMEEVQMGMCD